MFTGIVTAIGEIHANEPIEGGRDLIILARFRGIVVGESIAVQGACLTVTTKGRGWFGVRAVPSTLERTRFGELRPGDRVNLERALKAGDPLGGHLVQGHVDGLGVVVAVTSKQDARLVDLRVPDPVARVTIPLGSLTVDGVSLTVNALVGQGIIQVSLIPHTLAHTTLGALAAGDRVHLEGDVIGKYLQAFLEPRSQGAVKPGNGF
jgi:riboflavin synthase